MTHHINIGRKAEEAAYSYLVKKGYKILEVNWRWRKAEIDIIAMDEDELVFIEVKSRSSYKNGSPELSISPKKRMLLIDAATRYMEKIEHEWAIRFDIISIIVQNEQIMQLDHYQDSFSPWE
jgi:putative endonuclease